MKYALTQTKHDEFDGEQNQKEQEATHSGWQQLKNSGKMIEDLQIEKFENLVSTMGRILLVID